MGVAGRVANPTTLDVFSNCLPTMGRAKRLHGPLAFRQALGVSALKMRDALESAGCRVRTHQTVYTWERAERADDLPRGYWRRYYMPDAVVRAYHEMIVAYVERATKGRYTARVSGKRRWRVELRRVR